MRDAAEMEIVVQEIRSEFPRYIVCNPDEAWIREADEESRQILDSMHTVRRYPDTRYGDLETLEHLVGLMKRMVWGSRFAAVALSRYYFTVLSGAPRRANRSVDVAQELCEALAGAPLDYGELFALLSDGWLDGDTDLLWLWRDAIVGVPDILRAAGFTRDSLSVARRLAEQWLDTDPAYASIMTGFHARFSGGPFDHALLADPPDVAAMRAYLSANPIAGTN